MAPEVFIQSGHYSEKADVYSFGLCMWELFAEAIPFEELLSGELNIYLKKKNEIKNINK